MSVATIRAGGRTSSVFEPPSPERIRSGFHSASAARSGASELREVSARAPTAPVARSRSVEPARRRLLEQRDVPLPAREQLRELAPQRAIDLDVRRVALGAPQQPRAPGVERAVRRVIAPMEEVPREEPQYDAGVTRHFLTGAELTRGELTALIDRAAELKADRLASRRARRAGASRWSSRRRRRGRASRSRSASPSSAARRSCCAATSCSSSRGESPRDTATGALALRPRDRHPHRRPRAARGARRARHGAGRQHAHARPPPLPGARRPAHAARALRHARRAAARLRRRRQQRRRLADGARRARPASTSSSPVPPSWRLRPPPSSWPAPARRGRVARPSSPTRARPPPARTPSTPTSGSAWATTRRGRDARAPCSRRTARRGAARRRARRRDRAALPARPPRRGDRRGRPLRRRAPPSGTRPRTGCTPRRRCSSC